MDAIRQTLENLRKSSNLRVIPEDPAVGEEFVDLSSNDYIGLAENKHLYERFLASIESVAVRPGSSASRLLAGCQKDYMNLERTMSEAYRRPTLLFNSGYHANVGIIQALASKSTLFVADKLVHASIIDGMNLATTAGARFIRFRHNDFNHLKRIMETQSRDFDRVVIVAESVYSMDGDQTDPEALTEAKTLHPNALVYLDEAHAVGVLGQGGLGVAASHRSYDEIDIVVGTFGKALASMGAFAVTSPMIHDYLVNRCRSLIFSTALPPMTIRWSEMTFRHSLGDDDARRRLSKLSLTLADILGSQYASHIQPLILGSPERALAATEVFRRSGFKVLPIRTPTVPPGTDRLRFSLSAAIDPDRLLPLRDLCPALEGL